MKKLFYISIIFLIILFSCSKKKGNNKKAGNSSFELLILSKNAVSKSDLTKSMDISYRSYPNSNLSGRTFRFSIKNISNHKFLLRLRNVFDTYPGLLSKEGKNFDLDFLQIIETSFKDTIDISRHNVLNFSNEDTVSIEKKLINYFENLNYNKSIFWYEKNQLISSNFIYLKSKEKKYFEVYINLPYSDASYSGNRYDLDSTKNYNMSLKFTSDTTDIKKYLTWSQLKNIEENNYKLFHGTIVSENNVPIEFVD